MPADPSALRDVTALMERLKGYLRSTDMGYTERRVGRGRSD